MWSAETRSMFDGPGRRLRGEEIAPPNDDRNAEDPQKLDFRQSAGMAWMRSCLDAEPLVAGKGLAESLLNRMRLKRGDVLSIKRSRFLAALAE